MLVSVIDIFDFLFKKITMYFFRKRYYYQSEQGCVLNFRACHFSLFVYIWIIHKFFSLSFRTYRCRNHSSSVQKTFFTSLQHPTIGSSDLDSLKSFSWEQFQRKETTTSMVFQSCWRMGKRTGKVPYLSLIHIWRCRRLLTCRSRWSPYH